MSDTAGYSKRIYKKKYKKVVTIIANKIPLAFKTKADRKRWISEVTNARMNDIKKKKDCKGVERK